MAENSGISWTDHTFNGWIGCDEVGPGCDFCYARELDKKYQFGLPLDAATANREANVAPHWGKGAPRHRTAISNWRKPHSWNRAAAAAGVPAKVFSHSLFDVFDNEVNPAWRADLFDLWRATPWLRWIVVTKRVPNIRKMLPADWGDGFPNVGLLATVCNQLEYNRDAPRLLDIPARWHGFSMEPQLQHIILNPKLTLGRGTIWCITGGESAQGTAKMPVLDDDGQPREPRPYDPAWAAGLMTAAKMAPNVKVFVKQLGARPVGEPWPVDGAGADPRVWPEWLNVQEYPPEILT